MKNKKNIFLLFIIYLPAHILLLASRAIMWDGSLWTDLLKQKNYTTLYWILEQAKLFNVYAYYRVTDWLGKGNAVAASNVIVFLSWFIAGICVYLILKDFTRVGEKNSFFIASLFLLLPIFIARFEISIATYSLDNAAFFLGAYAFMRGKIASSAYAKIFLKIFAAILFIISFFTQSILVFYWLLIIFSFYIFANNLGIKKFIKQNLFWLLLPFIFYFANQKLAGAPYGMYESYNTIIAGSGASFIKILYNILTGLYQFFYYGLIWPSLTAVSILSRKIFFAVFLTFALGVFILNKKLKFITLEDDSEKNSSPKTLFIWGVISFIFGAGAYILVGKSPNPFSSGFNMRHGLLLPLGSSLILLALIEGLIKNNKSKLIIKILILSLFITYNIFNYYNVDMDWYKQKAVIEEIGENYRQNMINNQDSVVLFFDKLPHYSWQNRIIRDEEYSSYVYEATGNNKLMGTGANGGNLDFIMQIKKHDSYLKDGDGLGQIKNAVIFSNLDQEGTTVFNWIKLKMADLSKNDEELQYSIKKLLNIEIMVSSEPPKESSWLDKN